LAALDFLKQLSTASGVSGYEAAVRQIIAAEFQPYADEVRTDKLGSVIGLKRANTGQAAQGKIMLAGHLDEIGLMVTKIEKGFLRFTQVGGFDVRVLLGQEVLVHGQRPLPGIVGSRPPHVLPADERDKVIPMDELWIDVGLPEAEVNDLVQVGDLVTVTRTVVELKNNLVSGKAFDDRAAVVCLAECLRHLAAMKHGWDVYAVATVQEETGLKGAMTAAFGISPDIGIAIDVGHGDMPGVPEADTLKLGKGPGIAFGPNIHPKLYEKLVAVAKANEIPYQVDPVPGATGTDAWAIQVTREGVPTALLDIPLRYMHTSVETLSTTDLERIGRLLALFIVSLDDKTLGELKA
jgi:putative aminopeptidase FrvX